MSDTIDNRESVATTAVIENGLSTVVENNSHPANEGEEWKVGPGKPPLETRWRKGQSGNPAGRRNAGLVDQEWVNLMSGWSVRQLEEVANDPDAPSSKIIAAERRLAQIKRTHAERENAEELAQNATKLVWDYTNGKPTQRAEVKSESVSVAVTADLTRLSDGAKLELMQVLSAGDGAPMLIESDDSPEV